MDYRPPCLHSFASKVKHGTCTPGTGAFSICSYGAGDSVPACGPGAAAMGPGGCLNGDMPRHGCLTGNAAAETCGVGNAVS